MKYPPAHTALFSASLAILAGFALAQTPAAPPAKPPANAPPAAAPQSAPADPLAPAPVDAPAADDRWLENLPTADRSLLNQLLGYAPPTLPASVQWVGSEPAAWQSLRGNVLLIQSWSTGTDAARRAPLRALAAIKKSAAPDILLITLHTPESADKAAKFLERQAVDGALNIIDPMGELCDALGVYKKPVNILVDRQGAVRYAGLNPLGTEKALEALAAQEFDPRIIPAQRPEKIAAEIPDASFPRITGSVQYAKDIRGQSAPLFIVDEWKTDQPDLQGKVVVIDFWATWCGPCRQAIPHMNSLQQKFADEVVCIGISSETENKFDVGLEKYNLKLSRDFKYALALDPKDRMSGPINITGIPHCIVMSSDWIVRWQGMPHALKDNTLRQIVDANRALGPAGAAGASTAGNRWARELAREH